MTISALKQKLENAEAKIHQLEAVESSQQDGIGERNKVK